MQSIGHDDYRKRIRKALHISAKDFNLILNKFRIRYSADEQRVTLLGQNQRVGLPALSLLFRICKLVELMDISYEAFFDLVDVLMGDPSVRTYAHFPVLIHYRVTADDPYEILQGRAGMEASLWLIQLLLALGKWMQKTDFSGAEIRQILTGQIIHPTSRKLLQRSDLTTEALVQELAEIEVQEASKAIDRQIGVLNNLYQQFKRFALEESSFVSNRFDLRASRKIYNHLVSNGQLISTEDPRLINFDEEKAKVVASQALYRLIEFAKDDFLDFGVEEKMVDKIFTNLLIKGFIDANGLLNEARFPDQVEVFKINDSSEVHRREVFDLIHGLYISEGGNGDPSAVEFAVYPSDLELLEYSEERKKELYDNLIFNGYLDEKGIVLQPEFFADSTNYLTFQPNANIAPYSAEVHALIEAKIARFEEEQLVLDRAIFAGLSLRPIELEDLIENLRINDYIDSLGAYLEKNKILLTDFEDFLLSNPFNKRYGREILTAMKTQVRAFKDGFYTVDKELLRPLAKNIVADLIFDRLQQDHLVDGKLSAQRRSFFLKPANVSQFKLGNYFSQHSTRIVFKAIAKFVIEGQKYRLAGEDLKGLQLSSLDLEELFFLLHKQQYLQEQGRIPVNKIEFFLNSNNVHVFYLEGFDDYAEDLFLAIQEVAREVAAGIGEITKRLMDLSQAQEGSLFENLQEYLEVPADIVRSINNHILRPNNGITEKLMLPLLNTVNREDSLRQLPPDNNFRLALKRMSQFATLASKLGFGKEQVEVVFHDQDLLEKFPENIELPEEEERFDLLLEDTDGRIYLFIDNRYWVYAAQTYQLLDEEQPQPLSNLSPKFNDLERVDAAFVDPHDNTWIISGSQYFSRAKGSQFWKPVQRVWGRVQSNFMDPERIDAAFVDHEGKTYLFAGHQYVRYSQGYFSRDIAERGLSQKMALPVDEGYPKEIQGNWKNELLFDLPEPYYQGIDAAFTSPNGKTYLFKKKKFICSDDFAYETAINRKWGLVRNNFVGRSRIDAAFVSEGILYLFAGDQVMQYSDSLEHGEVLGDYGTLQRISSIFRGTDDSRQLPEQFEDEVNAVFKGYDGKTYLFSDDKYLLYQGDFSKILQPAAEIRNRWGRVVNNVRDTGVVDAALSGTDGRTYLFSGNQYIRYSRSDHAVIDEGYPRYIESDWGGIAFVDAAFVLDNKTYLFGRNKEQQTIYVCYSDNEYNDPDKGFPKMLGPGESFWNFAQADQLNNEEKKLFARPDAVFIGNDELTYLFKGTDYITSDHNHRWWTKPQPVSERWDSLPFNNISAAFTAKNGVTYFFEGYHPEESERSPAKGLRALVGTPTEAGLSFAAYTDKNYNKIDHRSPIKISDYWGQIVNHIERSGKVDAALTVVSRPVGRDEHGREISLPPERHTYLFRGNQFYRYTWKRHEVISDEGGSFIELASTNGNPQRYQLSEWEQKHIVFEDDEAFFYRLGDTVDEGYPRYIKNSLRLEPRFNYLEGDYEHGLDAASADHRNIFLFNGSDFEVISDTGSKVYTSADTSGIRCAFTERGTIYVEQRVGENYVWFQQNAIEQTKVIKQAKLPEVLREVPDAFKSNLNAVLLGKDRHAYLFKGRDCHNVLLDLTYPLKEEFGKVRNNIQIENKVDAAFVGKDGNTYLFSGDQYVVYRAHPDKPRELPAFINHPPKSIKENWFGLENVRLAFVKDEKSYLVEQWDQDGNFRFVCFSGNEYTRPEEPLLPDSHSDGGMYAATDAQSDAEDSYVQKANFSTWQVLSIPSIYYEEGFRTVNAVLQTEEHLFLLNENHFVHYSYTEDVWTYPRPMDRKWRNIALDLPNLTQYTPDLAQLHTAFTGPDGKIRFFSEESFITYDPEQRSF